MALKQPQIKELAKRMAMLNIEPEHLQRQIAPSLGLGDLSSPTAQAAPMQVAGGGDFAPNQWSQQGAMTLQEQVQAQTAQRRQMESNEKAKSSEVAPTSTTTAKPGAVAQQTPTLGNLMAPKDPMRSRAPVAPPAVSPAPIATPQGTPQPDWQQLAAEQQARMTPPVAPLAAGQVPDNVQNANGPANAGEAATLAEGTQSQKEMMDAFLQTLKTGDPEHGIAPITNPMGLAAAMSTATHESAFAPANVLGHWNDPSESGEAGTSGGSMSWRGPRFKAMNDFVAARGGNTIQNQALFFLQEDKNLINKLNNSPDAASAQQAMNQAWAFAGYDKPGNQEAADRIATANKLVPTVQTPGAGMLSSAESNIPPQQIPGEGLLSQPMNGDGRFTTADVDPTVTTSNVPVPAANPTSQFPAAPTPPEEKDADWLQGKVATIGKLGQLAQAMKGPALEPPKGTAPAPSQGSFNRDPNALKAIMAMMTNMGQSGGPPTLGQLMGGR